MKDIEYPKRLNLGCGHDLRAGYLNVDLHEKHSPDLVADVTDLSMLPNGYFHEIVAQDVLEHLERHKTSLTLQRWSDLLAQEGTIEIRVPSLLGLFEFLASPDWRSIEKTEEVIHLMYGTQAYIGDYHLAGFTAELLTEYLRRVGLQVCYSDLLHSWLFVVRARKTKSLTDAAEIVHNAYFRVMGRPADEGGLAHLKAQVEHGARIADVDRILLSSDEWKFRQTNSTYLVRYMTHFQSHKPPSIIRRLFQRLKIDGKTRAR